MIKVHDSKMEYQVTKDDMEKIMQAGIDEMAKEGIVSLPVFAKGVAEEIASMALKVIVHDGFWTGEEKLEPGTYNVTIVDSMTDRETVVVDEFHYIGADFSEVDDITVAYIKGRYGDNPGVMQMISPGKLMGIELDRVLEWHRSEKRDRKSLSAFETRPRKGWQTCHGPAKRTGKRDRHDFKGRMGRCCI